MIKRKALVSEWDRFPVHDMYRSHVFILLNQVILSSKLPAIGLGMFVFSWWGIINNYSKLFKIFTWHGKVYDMVIIVY